MYRKFVCCCKMFQIFCERVIRIGNDQLFCYQTTDNIEFKNNEGSHQLAVQSYKNTISMCLTIGQRRATATNPQLHYEVHIYTISTRSIYLLCRLEGVKKQWG